MNMNLRGIIILVFVIGALASLLYFLRDFPHYLQVMSQTKVGLLGFKKLAVLLHLVG